jgi:hypothetical protein
MDNFRKDLAILMRGVFDLASEIAVTSVVFTLPTVFFWNIVMPELFALPEITIVQAFCVNMLVRLLRNITSIDFYELRKNKETEDRDEYMNKRFE